MQEARVTMDGQPHSLGLPSLVLATRNPIESEGTSNLHEAQLDRFLFKLVADDPPDSEELGIMRLHSRGPGPEAPLDGEVRNVVSAEGVVEAQARCREVRLDERVPADIAASVRKHREWPVFTLEDSPRDGVAMLGGARAAAALNGRDYAVPDDVRC